jgi:hypothetical protein
MVQPRPAWICAPTSTTSSVARDFAERAPVPCASSRSFLILSSGDRVGGADEVHARVCELLECGIGLRGEVDREAALAVGDGDRRHAVGHEVDLLRERGVLRGDLGEQVVDRRLHAVRGGLAHDDDGLGGEERLEELRVALRERGTVEPREDLGAEDRVVFGERVATLDLDVRLRRAQERVEQACLVDDTGERVPVGAEQAVWRPQVELVLARALELLRVVEDLLAQPRVVAAAQPLRDRGVRADLAGRDLIGGDHAVRGERGVGLVEPEAREEDLIREVRVHRRRDVGEDGRVAIDEFGDAARVIDRALAAAARDVERALGEAEVFLHVDQEQVHARLVGRRRPHSVLRAPGRRRIGDDGGVGAIRVVGGALAVVKGRNR